MTKSSDKTILHVQPRTLLGKKSKNLSTSGQIPGNIFGQGAESTAVAVDVKALQKMIKSGQDAMLFYLAVEGQKKDTPVLLGEYDRHPVTGTLRHVSFRRVNLSEKVEAEVALEIINAPEVPDTTFLVLRNELTISALPTDIPESIVVDASVLTEAGQSISVAQLEYDKATIEVVLPEDATAEETLVAVLQEFKEQVIEETPAETEVAAEGDAPKAEEETSDKKAE